MTRAELVTCVLPAWSLRLPDWIWPFVMSDHCEGSPGAWLWLTILFAHFGVGVVIGLFPKRIALGMFIVWISKELGADIPIAGWSYIVMLDSLIDLSAGALGLGIAVRRLVNEAPPKNIRDL